MRKRDNIRSDENSWASGRVGLGDGGGGGGEHFGTQWRKNEHCLALFKLGEVKGHV